MNFLASWTWWVLLLLSCAIAMIPSLLHQISLNRLLLVLAAWTGSLALINTLFSIDAMIPATSASLLFGIISFISSLVLSGIKNMMKKRYR